MRIILFLLIFLSSCAHPVTRETADPAVAIPDSWSLFRGTGAAADRWWEAFGSQELNRLIRTALEGSLDLRQAFFRLEQSRALVVREGASRYPEL
ncbi:MAG: RND transporter, partial [Proteobacteria bacterium]|nr:RND transporter [Pseudomonadota bacterium]